MNGSLQNGNRMYIVRPLMESKSLFHQPVELRRVGSARHRTKQQKEGTEIPTAGTAPRSRSWSGNNHQRLGIFLASFHLHLCHTPEDLTRISPAALAVGVRRRVDPHSQEVF